MTTSFTCRKNTDPAPVTTLTVVPEPATSKPIPLWIRSGRAVRTAVTHDVTKTTARAMARHTLYVAGGAKIAAKRTWDGRTAFPVRADDPCRGSRGEPRVGR